jgi:non-canonical (house-cleaning) NTP pyrophosphatase
VINGVSVNSEVLLLSAGSMQAKASQAPIRRLAFKERRGGFLVGVEAGISSLRTRAVGHMPAPYVLILSQSQESFYWQGSSPVVSLPSA